MDRTHKFIFIITVFMLFALTLTARSVFADEQTSKAVFGVTWYGVGKSALEGLEGVKKVESGFYRLMEINTVYYDPAVITIKEMEDALIKAKTYKKTIQVEWYQEENPCIPVINGHG